MFGQVGAEVLAVAWRRFGRAMTLAVALSVGAAAPASAAPAKVRVPTMRAITTYLLKHGSADGAVPAKMMNAAIRKAGLKPHDVTIADMAPAGSVIALQPGGGRKVRKHSTVIVVVSKGEPIPPLTASTVPTGTVVPNVGNMTIGDAMATLQGAGFKVAPVYEQATNCMDDANGYTMGQTPEGGATAQPGTLVVVDIASGC